MAIKSAWACKNGARILKESLETVERMAQAKNIAQTAQLPAI